MNIVMPKNKKLRLRFILVILLLIVLLFVAKLFMFPKIEYPFPLSALHALPTQTPLVNLTATPTGEKIELLSTVQGLIAEDITCELPCFWGFKPGQTTNREVESFVHDNFRDKLSVGQTPSSDGVLHRSLSLTFNSTSPLQAMGINFTFKGDILSLLNINLSYPENWLPENRFQILNLLKTVEFSDTYIATHISTGSIGLVLISQDKNITVQYGFPLKVEGNVVSPLIDRPLLLCLAPDSTDHINLWLQNGKTDEPFDWLASNPQIPNSSLKIFQPIKWMTGLEADQFITRIIDNPDKCVEMLSYPELRKRGYDF